MFICTKCGLCCKNIDKIEELEEFDDGTGRCIYLSDDNLCMIYDRRPDICNVEKMYEKCFKNVMSIEEYEELNYKGCEELQKKF